MRDLYLEPPFRTSSSEVGATTSNSDHNRVNLRGPGHIRTSKWFPRTIIYKNIVASRGHLHEQARADYWFMENMSGHHIIPANQKLMRNEDLKTHIAEVERC